MLIVNQYKVMGAALVALLAVSAVYFAFTAGAPRSASMARADAARQSSIPAPARQRPASTALEPLANGQFVALIEQTVANSRSADRAQALIEARTSLLNQTPPHLQAHALDLLRRYIDYGEDSMTLPAAELGNLNALRNMLALRDVMRQKFFTAAEVEGLFGDQTRHDQFFVRKLEIQQQAELTPEQRRAALEMAEHALLNDAQRAARKEAVLHLDVSAQTDAMNAQAVNAESRFVERAQTYGAEAASRLAALDLEAQRWNLRLDQYARADSESREQLGKTLFTAEEALRLDAAIELRRQRTIPNRSPVQ